MHVGITSVHGFLNIKNSHLPRILTIHPIEPTTGCDSASIGCQGHTATKPIAFSFSLDTPAELLPSVTVLVVPKDSGLTGTFSVYIAPITADRQSKPIVREGDGSTEAVTRCFAVNGVAQGFPPPSFTAVLKYPYFSTFETIPSAAKGPRNQDLSIGRK